MLRGMDSVRFTCMIEKSEPDQRRFWGRAYIHKTADGQVIDYSGDIVDTPETQAALEEAFYDYVKESRSGDLEHVEFGAADMIEGFIVTAEKKSAGLFPESMAEGIYIGYQANDTDAGDLLWEGVKSGRLKALSIVGEGLREPL